MLVPPRRRSRVLRAMMASTAIAELDRDAAARHLVAHASRRGFAIAFDLLGNRAEAEDAVQDALVRTLTDVHRRRDPDALEGWFFRVLANGCIGALRRRRVARGVAAIFGLRERVVEPVVAGDHARLLRELDRLPAMQKAA